MHHLLFNKVLVKIGTINSKLHKKGNNEKKRKNQNIEQMSEPYLKKRKRPISIL